MADNKDQIDNQSDEVTALKAKIEALAEEVANLQEENDRKDEELASLRKAIESQGETKKAVKPDPKPLKPFTYKGKRVEWTLRRFRAYGEEHEVTDVQENKDLLEKVITDFPQLIKPAE